MPLSSWSLWGNPWVMFTRQSQADPGEVHLRAGLRVYTIKGLFPFRENVARRGLRSSNIESVPPRRQRSEQQPHQMLLRFGKSISHQDGGFANFRSGSTTLERSMFSDMLRRELRTASVS